MRGGCRGRSARVREAVDQAVADRIGRVQEDDRDPVPRIRRRVLGRRDRLVLERDDQINVLANEFLGLLFGLVLAVQVAPDQLDPLPVVLPLDLPHPVVDERPIADQLLHHRGRRVIEPADVTESRHQRRQRGRVVVGPDMHHTDPRNGLGRRAARGVACGEAGEHEDAQKP